MALCIAYLCISSFSASFCKRNIIKIIMKIRFCELSSLGAPVFMALLVPWGLPFWAVPWAVAVDWILQRPWGWARAWDGHGGMEHRGKDSPQTLQGGLCPPTAAGSGPPAPHPDPRAVPSGLGQPLLWGGLPNPSLQVENLSSSCSAASAHQEWSWAGPCWAQTLAQTPLNLQSCSSHPVPSAQ